MCGIAGFCNLKGDWRANIAKMNERMHHRGPDAEGVFASGDERVVLGHKRLSIVDLSVNGAQPMESHSGRYVMAYNGEIYNYKKIARKLLEGGKVKDIQGRFGYGSVVGGDRSIRCGKCHCHEQRYVCHCII